MTQQTYINSRSILVVDDFDVERACYRRYIERSAQHNYRLIEAETCEEAVALIQQKQPDVVLLEYCLPEETAPSIINQLKELNKPCHSAVIVMIEECQAAPKMAAAAMQAGAQAYLVKDRLTDRILLTTINQVIASNLSQGKRSASESLTS